MNDVYLLLGSNQGNSDELLRNAIELLYSSCGQIIKQSSVYETAAWGITDQPGFLNMAVQIQTILTPIELLAEIHVIESTLGRQREIKWGQRTLDIDILFYGDEVINFPELVVPHPLIQERRFTLAPLTEIAPGYIHPILHKTIAELLFVCPDKLDVHLKGKLGA